MIASETWRIYKANASWLFLAGLLAEAAQAGLALLFGRYWAKDLVGAGLTEFGMANLDLARMPQSLGAQFLGVGSLYVILSLLVGVFTTGGLLHLAALAQRGSLHGIGGFWAGGARHWGRMLGYGLLSLLPVIGLGLASMLVLWIPLLFIPLLAVAAGSLGVAYWYGAYALVAEDLGATEAFGKLFRILGSRFSDVIWSLLLLLAAGLVLGLVSGVLSKIPFLGPLLNWLLNAAVTPLLMLYVGVRYVTNIAPVINPPGGTGSFHPSPPPGP